MDNQYIILIIVVFLVLGFIAWGIFVGSEGGTFVKEGRFRAKPSAIQNNVQPIVVKDLIEKDLSRENERSEGKREIQNPEVFIEKILQNIGDETDVIRQSELIEHLIEKAEDEDEKSIFLLAKVHFFLKNEWQSFDNAKAIAQLAYRLARHEKIRRFAARTYVELLEKHQKNEELLTFLGEALSDNTQGDLVKIFLHTKRGLLAERLLEKEKAIENYSQVLNLFENTNGILDSESFVTLQTVSFRLAKLYREEGLEESAEEVARRFQRLQKVFYDSTNHTY